MKIEEKPREYVPPTTPRPVAGADPMPQVNVALSAEERAAQIRAQRSRIPMSVPRRKLEVPELPGWFTYWFATGEGNVQQALRAGYTFVTADEIASAGGVIANGIAFDDPSDGNRSLTNNVEVYAGIDKAGKPQQLVLMKIPMEIRRMDETEMARVAGAPLKTIMRGQPIGENGAPSNAENTYTPKWMPPKLETGKYRVPVAQQAGAESSPTE